MATHPKAFTLIELLVVVTIIVVLLALLTPALDKALYAAEMAVDGAQMRGVGAAMVTYAMANRRTYPDRGPNSSYDAMRIKQGQAFDITKRLAGYVTADSFVDPFLADANLDVDKCMADPTATFMPGYNVFIDWSPQNVSPMKRVGQKMTFTAPAPENETRRFGVLMACRDSRQPGYWTTTSHPDDDGKQTLWARQKGTPDEWSPGGSFMGPVSGDVYVAWWVGAPTRGLVDNHYAMDDGSVLRLNDVPVVEIPDEDDPRITFVTDAGEISHYSNNRKTQLPKSAQ